ncbi:hypothetical protein GMJAKD_03365 [Candidatus Electrothrix aarhusensis]
MGAVREPAKGNKGQTPSLNKKRGLSFIVLMKMEKAGNCSCLNHECYFFFLLNPEPAKPAKPKNNIVAVAGSGTELALFCTE